MLLAGKKVVVVGGSSGIGLATAEMAKREGAEIIIASRNAERLDKAAEKLNAIAIPADVTSDDSVAELFSVAARSIMSWSRRRSFAPARSRRSRWKMSAPPWKASSGAHGVSRSRRRSAPADR